VLLGRLAETGIFRTAKAADHRIVSGILERLAIIHHGRGNAGLLPGFYRIELSGDEVRDFLSPTE